MTGLVLLACLALVVALVARAGWHVARDWRATAGEREAERVADRAARNADHSAAFRAWNDERETT